jgi:hypothetical protein
MRAMSMKRKQYKVPKVLVVRHRQTTTLLAASPGVYGDRRDYGTAEEETWEDD